MGLSLPYVSINPSFLAIYYKPVEEYIRSDRQKRSEVNLLNNEHHGVISKKAEKRIRRAIDWMIALSSPKKILRKDTGMYFKFSVNFITLTLASKQIHSDNEIKSQLLNQFLIEARKRWKIINYVWRAEAQGNGNIHFHITSDKFVPYWQLDKVWNRIQNKLGYVDRYCFENKGLVPPSTNVRGIKKIDKISSYFSKELTKNQGRREIKGKLWGLSHSLSKIKSIANIISNKMDEEIRLIQKIYHNYIKTSEYYQVIYIKPQIWGNKVKGALYDLYTSSLYELKQHNLFPDQYVIPV